MATKRKKPKEVRARTGAPARFRAATTLVVQLVRLGRPVASVRCELEYGGMTYRDLETNDEGILKQEVPGGGTREAKLTLVDEGEIYSLVFGALKAVKEDEGVQSRLLTLGYYEEPHRDKDDQARWLDTEDVVGGDLSDRRTQGALMRFQAACGLKPTGEADGHTRRLLKHADFEPRGPGATARPPVP